MQRRGIAVVPCRSIGRQRRPYRPLIAPLSADRYRVQITVSAETVERRRRLQDLIPDKVADRDASRVSASSSAPPPT